MNDEWITFILNGKISCLVLDLLMSFYLHTNAQKCSFMWLLTLWCSLSKIHFFFYCCAVYLLQHAVRLLQLPSACSCFPDWKLLATVDNVHKNLFLMYFFFIIYIPKSYFLVLCGERQITGNKGENQWIHLWWSWGTGNAWILVVKVTSTQFIVADFHLKSSLSVDSHHDVAVIITIAIVFPFHFLLLSPSHSDIRF